jgi:hypothetical protein
MSSLTTLKTHRRPGGRPKNYYGSRSSRGCEVAALFYSLIETAKLCGVEPKIYLLRATSRALDHPGAVTLPKS